MWVSILGRGWKGPRSDFVSLSGPGPALLPPDTPPLCYKHRIHERNVQQLIKLKRAVSLEGKLNQELTAS